MADTEEKKVENQEILDKDIFEKLRLYNPDDKVNKLISEKIKNVLTKLLNANNDKLNLKPEEVYCSGYNSDEVGAFTVTDSQYIKDPKYKAVLAVSGGLIKQLDNEDEFAAVLAHELGHYYWQLKFPNNKNTIFQEQSCDTLAVEFMMNAGYNPNYAMSAWEKIGINGNKNFSDVIARIADVHGSDSFRLNNVMAAIAVLERQRGKHFTDIDKDKTDIDWNFFKIKTVQLLPKEDQESYIDTLLEYNFGTTSFYDIRDKFGQMVLLQFLVQLSGMEEIKNNKKRQDDFFKKLVLYIEMLKKTGTKQEEKFLQDIFMNTYQWDYADIYLKDLQLQLFGIFKEFNDCLTDFSKNVYNKDNAVKYAEKILKYDKNIYKYLDFFADYKDKKDVSIFTGFGKDNIGKLLPFEQLKSYDNQSVNDVIRLYYNNISYGYKDTVKTEIYSVNKNGIVQEYLFEDFYDNKIKLLNLLAKYDKEKSVQSCLDCWDFIDKHDVDELFGNHSMLPNEFDVLYQKIYNRIQNEYFYNYFGCQSNIYDSGNKSTVDHHLDLKQEKLRPVILNVIDFATQKSLNKDKVLQVYDRLFFIKDSEIILEHAINNKYVIEKYSGVLKYSQFISLAYHILANGSNIDDANKTQKILDFLGITPPKNKDELYNICYTLKDSDEFIFNLVLFNYMAKYELDVIDFVKFSKDNKLFDHFIIGLKLPQQNFIDKRINVESYKKYSVQDKIDIYDYMLKYKFFSTYFTHKNDMLKILVNDITKYKINETNFNTQETNNRLRLAVNILLQEYGEYKEKRCLGVMTEREKLLDYIANYWAVRLGKDTRQMDYLNKVDSCVKWLDNLKTINKEGINICIENLSKKIADKITAQFEIANLFDAKYKSKAGNEDAVKYDWPVRIAQNVVDFLCVSNLAEEGIEFLTNNFTDESCNKFLSAIQNKPFFGKEEWGNKQVLEQIHDNFSHSPLPVQAYFLNPLLDGYSKNPDEKIQFVLNRIFKSMKTDEETKNAIGVVIESVYNNETMAERNFDLCTLLTMVKTNNVVKNTDSNQQIGRGLKGFFQYKGDAFIKFGQMLSYLPSLPAEIRTELATLRDKASVPDRKEIFDMLKQSLPSEEYSKISYVGDVLGAGSIYVTVQVKYDNQDCVVALMRENIQNKMMTNLDFISGTIKSMVWRDEKKFGVLKNIFEQAEKSCHNEIDIDKDYEKYKQAVDNYSPFEISLNNQKYKVDVAEWVAFGAMPNNKNAFKIMKLAKGDSLTSAKHTDKQQHDNAKAYVALELAILLSGKKWDTDRHAGQQNFYTDQEGVVHIGIFDTGAQIDNLPSDIDRRLLGLLIYKIIQNSRKDKSISDVLNKAINDIQNNDETIKKYITKIMYKYYQSDLRNMFFAENKYEPMLNMPNIQVPDTSVIEKELIKQKHSEYLECVRRGLLALSDIIEYKKPFIDEDGKHHPGKSLTDKDFFDIIVALKTSGVIDKNVNDTFTDDMGIKNDLFYKMISKILNKNMSVKYNHNHKKIKILDKIINIEDVKDYKPTLVPTDRIKNLEQSNSMVPGKLSIVNALKLANKRLREKITDGQTVQPSPDLYGVYENI